MSTWSDGKMVTLESTMVIRVFYFIHEKKSEWVTILKIIQIIFMRAANDFSSFKYKQFLTATTWLQKQLFSLIHAAIIA